MNSDHIGQASVNLTVRRVNTSRPQPHAATGLGAMSVAEAKNSKTYDLPWTPEVGQAGLFQSPLPNLASPKQNARGCLPLFQPSPRRAILSSDSPAGNQFGFSLEAMLNSPMCSSGAGALLASPGGVYHGFDTPSTRSALLESIFASTPQRGSDPHSQLKSSQSQISNRGSMDVGKVQTSAGDQSAKQETLDEKHDDEQVAAAQPGAHAVHKLQQQMDLSNHLLQRDPFATGLLPFENALSFAVKQHLQQAQAPNSVSFLTPAPGLAGADLLDAKQGLFAGFSDAITGEADQVKSDSDNSHGSVLPPSQVADAGNLDPTGNKTCHCKKSQCLKLYCECFAAGLFCANCSCISCRNRPEHGTTVMERRDQIMSRDPQAFSNKIMAKGLQPGTHKKGCNCKRSNCLKKYCECFQGGVKCGAQCKCLECKNLEGKPGPRGGGAKGASLAQDFVPNPGSYSIFNQNRAPTCEVVAEMPAHAGTTSAAGVAPLLHQLLGAGSGSAPEHNSGNKKARLSNGNNVPSTSEPTVAYGSGARNMTAAGFRDIISPLERQASGPLAGGVTLSSGGALAQGSNKDSCIAGARFSVPGALRGQDLEKLAQELEAAQRASFGGENTQKATTRAQPRAWGSQQELATNTVNKASRLKRQHSKDNLPTSSAPDSVEHSKASDLQFQGMESPTRRTYVSHGTAKITSFIPMSMLGQGMVQASAKPGDDVSELFSALRRPSPQKMPTCGPGGSQPQVAAPARGQQWSPTASGAQEGCRLQVKAPPPKRPVPLPGCTLSPTLAAMGCSPMYCSQPSSAWDADRALEALLMSPTASDGFDPMRMLASPLCSGVQVDGLFDCNTPIRAGKSLAFGRLTPGSTSFLPSPQSDRIKPAEPFTI